MAFSLTVEQKQTVIWSGMALAFFGLLISLGPILTPFIAAGIIAYALNPGVDWLARLRFGRVQLPRAIAVTIMVLALVLSICTLLIIVIPVLEKESSQLQEQIPTLLQKANDVAGPKLHDLGIRVRLDGAGLKQLMNQYFARSGEEIWSAVLSSAKVGGVAVLGWLATAFLVPVVLFYLLLDWHRLWGRVKHAVPRRWIKPVTAMTLEVDSLLAQYLRGQLTVMLVLAVYYSSALRLAGFDVAMPVGILTGLLVFIPYIGFGMGLVLATLAAVLQFEGWNGLVSVAVIYGAGQIIEGFFLTPRLVGERIGMPPLAVIFALLAFGQLFGFAGVLLALPASAVVMVALKHLRKSYLESSFYNQV